MTNRKQLIQVRMCLFGAALLTLTFAVDARAQARQDETEPEHKAEHAKDHAKHAPEQAKDIKHSHEQMNAKFLKPDIDVQAWAERWEGESREVFRERLAIVEALAIEPGMSVADVGAGTGLFTGLFSQAVGKGGHVYAVDISPAFVTHIRDKADSLAFENVTAVLSRFTSATLAPASVDLVFLCDTYHHFDNAQAMLASIHSALDKGGRLAVIDFRRVEGETLDWIMEHTRAGQETFVSEIQSAGFDFLSEVALPGLEENYFVLFEKR